MVPEGERMASHDQTAKAVVRCSPYLHLPAFPLATQVQMLSLQRIPLGKSLYLESLAECREPITVTPRPEVRLQWCMRGRRLPNRHLHRRYHMGAEKTAGSCSVSFLIENNDPEMREKISAQLKRKYANSNIILLDDYHDSLEKLMEFTPDIFIVDIDSQQIGVQIIKLAKILHLHTNVIVTGDDDTKTIGMCLSNGVKGYIIKPIDGTLMLKTIDDALKGLLN
jgi:CheY-like chemotaxis protein